MAKGFNIRAWLGLDTKDYEKGVSRAKRQTRQFTKGLKTSMKGAAGAAGGFLDRMTGGAVTGFTDMFKGVKMASKGMKGLRGAIISTGIGALVVVLGSLVSYFTQTKAGVDLVSKGMDAFGAVMDAIKSRIAQVGGAIVKLFQGDFKGAYNDAKGAFSGFGDQIEDNYNKSKKLSDREAQLKRDQIKWIKEEKRLLNEKSELLLKSKDKENYSAEQRHKFEKQAGEIVRKVGEEKKRLLDEEIATLKERQAQGENTYEDDKALAELEAQRMDVQKQMNDQLREIENRLNTSRNEQEKNTQQAEKEAEAWQKSLERVLALNEALKEEVNSGGTELDDQYDFITPLEQYQTKLKELQEQQKKAFTPEQYKQLQEEIDATQEKMDEFKGKTQEVNEEVSASFSEVGESIANSFGIAKDSFAGFALTLMDTLPQLGDQLNQLGAQQLLMSKKKIAAKQSEAIASGTASAASAPWFMTLPMIASIVGTITSIFSSLPKFESGGILGGNSMTGDKLLFRGNSGEMILNRGQQRNLLNMINKGGTGSGGQVQFEIKGDKLVGVLKNHNNRTNSYR